MLSANFHQRPSQIVGVSDEWAAYQFDLCVVHFGSWVEGKLAERDSSGRPKHTLAGLLDDGTAAQARQFAPVSAVGLRKVRVKEDGTWDD